MVRVYSVRAAAILAAAVRDALVAIPLLADLDSGRNQGENYD